MRKKYFWFFFEFSVCNWLYLLLIVVLGNSAVECVEIRRLLVPRWVQNGTEDFVVLDCDYVYNENDFRLVVKWFFEDSLEPVYQWIPELGTRHTSGVLAGKLDLDFSVNSADAYSRFRALKIRRPSVELSGKYTCLVTSLAGQDSREQNMTVFVPANHFELTFVEANYDSINVTCEGRGLFPSPVLKLYSYGAGRSSPRMVQDAKATVHHRPSGAYDIHLQRTFSVQELSEKGDTMLECMLELPGTNYVRKKRVAYYPGIQGQRIGDSRDAAVANQRSYLVYICVGIFTFCFNFGGQA